MVLLMTRMLKTLLLILSAIVQLSCTSINSLDFGVWGTYENNNETLVIERVKVPFIDNDKTIYLEALLYYNPENTNSNGAIMTHGRNGPYPLRNKNDIFAYRSLNLSLVQQGYTVLYLIRRGYGNSEGSSKSEFLETPALSGLAASQDLKAGVEFLKKINSVNKKNMIIIGHSQGGWASLAASNLNIPEVIATVNLAGGTNYSSMGLGFITNKVQMDWITGCGELGQNAKIPTIWIYCENDKNHPSQYVDLMFKSFKKNGGTAYIIYIPPYGKNGHYFVNNPNLFMELLMSKIEYLKS